MSRVSVVGAGYVGLVTAACLAKLGHEVTCVEIDPRRLRRLELGQIPFHEPGLAPLVQRYCSIGRLAFTEDYAESVGKSEFVFIAVNTPPRPDGEADTGYVFAAARSALEHARQDAAIVVKSTVPVGTGDEIARLADTSRLAHVPVVSNPEFLREGSAISDFLRPDRIVVGTDRCETAEAIIRLYQDVDSPIIICSRRAAEMAKYAANALLATRVSFMNEVATLCEVVGVDVGEVARIVGLDPRIGPSFLNAGLGWGGSCLPKDVRALAATARAHGCRTQVIEAAFHTNALQRVRAAEKLLAAVQGIPEPTVGFLGLAFKPGTDDTREAPALDIISRLLADGIRVRAHDPVAMPNAREVEPGVEYCADPYEMATLCDAILLATEWREYLALDWHRMRALMRGSVVVDGRNALDARAVSRAGLTYLSFGRQTDIPGGICPPQASLAAAEYVA